MEYSYSKGCINYPNKELTLLDKVVLDFLSYVDCKYVIVSGYVAILFGRSRNTEDIDLFIERLDYSKFSRFYQKIVLSGKYYCINAEDAKDAYELLDEERTSIRFAEKGSLDPNFEIKFPHNSLSRYSLENPITVELNNNYLLKIGPLELQLAYKLYLGSEKDYLDAAHLYRVFGSHIDKERLKSFTGRLQVSDTLVRRILSRDAL